MITGYIYYPYFFPVLPTGKISGLCGVKYRDEQDLLADWDSQHGGYTTAPPLVRVSDGGEEVILRPCGMTCEFCGDIATRVELFDRPVFVCDDCSASEQKMGDGGKITRRAE